MIKEENVILSTDVRTGGGWHEFALYLDCDYAFDLLAKVSDNVKIGYLPIEAEEGIFLYNVTKPNGDPHYVISLQNILGDPIHAHSESVSKQSKEFGSKEYYVAESSDTILPIYDMDCSVRELYTLNCDCSTADDSTTFTIELDPNC
jgi:hypothetical protein